MEYNKFKIILSSTLILLLFISCNPNLKPTPSRGERILENIRQTTRETDSLISRWAAITTSLSSSEDQQRYFIEARKNYKKIEWYVEYISPGTARLINGAAIPEVEVEEGDKKFVAPTGFQVIEEILYPNFDSSQVEHLKQELSTLQASFRRVNGLMIGLTQTDANTFEAMRLQLTRIITLGISGYDSPTAFRSLSESADAIRGLQQTWKLFDAELEKKSPDLAKSIAEKLNASIESLEKDNIDFNTFNRIEFIIEFINPLSVALHDAQGALSIDYYDYLRPTRVRSKTIFDKNAFDTEFYTPTYARHNNPQQVLLGKFLFNDPILSDNGKRACASCHQANKAFTDGLPKALSIKSEPKLRNTPTLLNAALQTSSSYDQSTLYLEDRIQKVLESKDEMHSSLDVAAKKIVMSDEYVSHFQKAFSNNQAGFAIPPSTVVTGNNLKIAIGAYIRTLISMNAHFDQYIQGDRSKLNAQEKHGFNLFMGKAKCGTCHFMPLFNGTIPPNYSSSESEVIGVPENAVWKNAKIDPDVGKMILSGVDIYKYSFKTPTVRNTELTAPYMHNGVYKTLEEVVRFYNVGGGKGIGIELPNQTLPFDSLALSESEVKAVVAFIKTLTDTTGLTSKPTSLPKFSNAKLNNRKIGGEY